MSIILLYLITNFYGIFDCFYESAIGTPAAFNPPTGNPGLRLILLAPPNGDIRLCRLHGANSAARLPGSASYCWRLETVT